MKTLILCGGAGTRLWPVSRQLMPKQFSRFLGEFSLFEETVRRNRGLCDGFLIASNADQAVLASGQLGAAGIGAATLVVEPVGRNTAPAIALACLALPADELVLVCPSDHRIANEQAYKHIVQQAKELADGGVLVTFGIHAAAPETGFGYIELDGSRVLSFKEKPDAATAQRYVEAGNYYWNSGMFCFRAGVFLAELRQHAPAVYAAAETAYRNAENGERIKPTLADMQAIPAISIDYAVMEKSSNVRCVPCPADLGWSDLGSFDAVYDTLAASGSDARANVASGGPAPVLAGASGNLILAGRQVALVDVSDLIVVDTADALLVTRRGASQRVKEVTDSLAAAGSPLVKTFPLEERPWGTFEVLYEAEGYKVKRIMVRPGQRLSLQRHRQREERWTVVCGEAVVEVDGDCRVYRPGEVVVIPLRAVHRLQNTGSVPVVVIETQLGPYLGEDDIERLADDYKRD